MSMGLWRVRVLCELTERSHNTGVGSTVSVAPGTATSGARRAVCHGLQYVQESPVRAGGRVAGILGGATHVTFQPDVHTWYLSLRL